MNPLLARDVMTAEVTTVTPETPISKFIRIVKKKHYSGLPVVDRSGKPVGLVSQNDVLRALAWGEGKSFQKGKRKAAAALLNSAKAPAPAKFLARPVKDVMTPGLISCAPDTPVADVCATMVERKIHRVVVLDGGRIAGLISATDLVRALGRVTAARR
jgi:CBS domain-containing protein